MDSVRYSSQWSETRSIFDTQQSCKGKATSSSIPLYRTIYESICDSINTQQQAFHPESGFDTQAMRYAIIFRMITKTRASIAKQQAILHQYSSVAKRREIILYTKMRYETGSADAQVEEVRSGRRASRGADFEFETIKWDDVEVQSEF